MCFGRCPVYNLFIDSMGNGSLEAIRYNQNILEGTYHCTLNKSLFNTLTNALNYIDITRFKEFYNVGVTDQATSIIDLTFTDGTHKRIRDYGRNGEFSLRFLYRYFDSFRYSQNWQR